MRKLKRSGTLFMAALLVALGLSVVVSPRAEAAWHDCSNHTVCFWVDINANGAKGWVSSSVRGCSHFIPPFVHSISSVYNRTIYPVRFFTQGCTLPYSGYWYTVSPGQQINFVSWPHKDAFESIIINP